MYPGRTAQTCPDRPAFVCEPSGEVVTHAELDARSYRMAQLLWSLGLRPGGMNIYPQEVENLLVTHPKVADAAVFGVPNEEFGEEVKAVIQLVDPASAGDAVAEELLVFCRASLSHVKCPRSVDFAAELPRHPSGKLYRRLLKDRYWGNRGSRIV